MIIYKKIFFQIIRQVVIYIFFLMIFPLSTYASFIESTIGTAVVNDATASYFNPAALVLLKNPQVIPQGTIAYFHTRFSGQSKSVPNGITQTGSSSSNTDYYSPSLYLGAPLTDKIIVGLAIVSNSANRTADENSILRYVQASNSIQDFDVVPAFAYKVNESLSIGAGVNFSYASFNLLPITGFPGSNIADSQSRNQSDGTGVGGNAGFLIKLGPNTLIGFNYRSRTTYQLSGTSVYEGNPRVVSNSYHYKSWTPARSVISMNHFFTSKFGLISTVQRIQWNSFTNAHIYGIASVSGTTPLILNGTIPYHLRNTWLVTLGSHYRLTPKWIIRVAGSYNQSPGNPHYQVANGNSIVFGGSMGYQVNKMITIDASYAHVFMQDEHIDIAGGRYLVNGVNEGARDAVSLKLTLNV